ncbi:MAG: TasA family protein [Eubacteriales bacterium]|nr:TasA family protein [Eubacteriales bacterium]
MKKKLIAITCAAALTLTIGGTFAYLTDSDQAVNEFTVGKVTIDLTEPSWDPEDNTEITPLDEIEKDPQITNTGKNDAYVFLEVAIPKRELILADAKGNRLPKETVPLFTYEKNEGWELIATEEKEDTNSYIYAYNQILSPDQTTESLFDTIRFQNVIEGQVDGEAFNIPVYAYAIQSDNTGDGKTSIIDQAKAAFEKYELQNAGQDKPETKNGSGEIEQP